MMTDSHDTHDGEVDRTRHAPTVDDDGTITLLGVGPECPGCGGPTHAVTAEDAAEIYEVDVQLRQSAIVAVEATSREEAWEALRMPHDRDVQEHLVKTQFKGAEYEPEDIIAVGDVDEADISVLDDGED